MKTNRKAVAAVALLSMVAAALPAHAHVTATSAYPATSACWLYPDMGQRRLLVLKLTAAFEHNEQVRKLMVEHPELVYAWPGETYIKLMERLNKMQWKLWAFINMTCTRFTGTPPYKW